MRAIALAGLFACCTALADPACLVVARPAYAPWVFLGYRCTAACAEHKAGFAWAEINGIAESQACTVGDRAFVEGCRAYAESAVTAELAGFEWARENELTATCACGGAGSAFREGCAAYVEVIGD